MEKLKEEEKDASSQLKATEGLVRSEGKKLSLLEPKGSLAGPNRTKEEGVGQAEAGIKREMKMEEKEEKILSSTARTVAKLEKKEEQDNGEGDEGGQTRSRQSL
ncbi:hypothetical protein GUITHDRAFT_121981 [Guillardia theta CCMP2712]|uniref:Uncharacterized protein n=1 Tax=Guillardia theta (strain CCMP2712) TaxID=905079 RepID=L1I7K6_GUITC|nr:hypothetical protein GUITHDRAFT_121981 [Guillardia theta CCMP2712]EKX31820.1 hypothetical protein GUITHDRAFT_121981 [Guillardia theta CCMP2712]|eukprot:XP_005818800.1 hypothetical protein GUITHDRAFT_121981 [Guillardia theta CCMP2712]